MRLAFSMLITLLTLVMLAIACSGGSASDTSGNGDGDAAIEASPQFGCGGGRPQACTDENDAGLIGCAGGDSGQLYRPCPSGSHCAFFGGPGARVLGYFCAPLVDGSYNPCASGCIVGDASCAEEQSDPPHIVCPQ